MTRPDPCKKCDELLTAYLLGDLPHAQAAEVQDHLDDCESCRASLQELKSTLDLLQDALAADATAPATLDPERRVRIRQAQDRAPLIKMFAQPRFLVNAAAVLMILGLLSAVLIPAIRPATMKSSREANALSSDVNGEAPSFSGERLKVASAPSREAGALNMKEFGDVMAKPQEEMKGRIMETFYENSRVLAEGTDMDVLSSDETRREFEMTQPMAETAPPAAPPASVSKGAEWALSDLSDLSDPSDVYNEDNKQRRGARVRSASMGGVGSAEADELVAALSTTDTESKKPESRIIGRDVAFAYGVSGDGMSLGESVAAAQPLRSDIPVLGDTPIAGAAFRRSGSTSKGKPDRMVGEEYAFDKANRPAVENLDAEQGRMIRDHGDKLPRVDADSRSDSSVFFGQTIESGKKAKTDVQVAVDSLLENELIVAASKPAIVADLSDPSDLSDPTSALLSEPPASPVFRAYGVNPYVQTEDNRFSTFGIDVDTAAYTLARKYIRSGHLPPAESVRTEEFVNFFDYGYRAPAHGTFAVYTEYAPAPFGEGYLLKIGVKGRRLGREEQRRAALTFVIDTSGSMDTPDRIGLLKHSLRMLVGQLAPEDTVTIVQYDSRARLVLESTPAAERDRILQVIERLRTSGSTHLEEGLRLGYEMAARSFEGGAVNRVLLLSDGAANLGSADADQILRSVESFRDQGIYCSVFGFGRGTYNDVMLETLANKGDGTYQFIDTANEAKRVFVDDLSATLNVIASDVKIQVEFDPEHVASYRQLGYENRQLKTEDFRNDTVDAGEVGSGQSVTALYEVMPVGSARGPLATVRVRYRVAATGEIEEIAKTVTAADMTSDFSQVGPRFKLAAGVAEFAEILRGSPFAEGSDFEDVAKVLRPVALELRLDKRVRELNQLVRSAPGMSRATE